MTPFLSFAVYAITDRHRLPPRRSLPEQVELLLAHVPRGSVAVQLRERDLSDRELLAVARDVAKVAHERGGQLYINGRADVALAVGAAGVHLGTDAPVATVVRRRYPALRIGASAHDGDELGRATGAHFALLSPLLPTWKPTPSTLGPEGFRRLAASFVGPCIALGGIGPATAPRAWRSGAAGVAMLSAWMEAEDPASVVLRVLAARPRKASA